jgi:hypothetical protein
MDELAWNKYISIAVIIVITIAALIVFSTNRVEISVSESRSGWIVVSSGENTSVSLSHVNCSYEISNELSTNSTTIAGVVQETFTASKESSNFTYAIHSSFAAMGTDYSVDAYTRAALESKLSIAAEEYFDHYPPFLGLDIEPMNNTMTFNNTYSEQYTFTMEWALLLTFFFTAPFDARFFCNISFKITLPNLVTINIPSSLGFDSFVAVAIGVVIISMAARVWNRPKVVDDTKA